MKYEVVDKKYTPLILQINKHFVASTNHLHDARNQLRVLSYPEEQLVAKSFKTPHIINKIAYTFFRDSKAKKSYDNSMKIIEFVPRPIGYIEFKKYGLLSESYFISEYFEYDFTIREPLLQDTFIDRKNIFKAFAKFTYNLHRAGIKHLDYSPGNILIQKIDSTYKFKVVDVNRMKFKMLTQNECLENFAKLWAKDEDLALIIQAYAPLIGVEENRAFEIARKASQKHKNRTNFKKRLKGKKVVD
jgi:serine/threonine protein kinase